MTIALTGFMGCGKSSVAACLAQRLGCFFFDLDDTIRMGEELSVPEIFSQRGEKAFRKLEFEYLERILSDYEEFPVDMVLALGGGTVTTPECANLLKDRACTVYLRAGLETLVSNLEIAGIQERPLLCGTKDLRTDVGSLLGKRSPIYEKTADVIIDTDGLSDESIADRIISSVGAQPRKEELLH